MDEAMNDYEFLTEIKTFGDMLKLCAEQSPRLSSQAKDIANVFTAMFTNIYIEADMRRDALSSENKPYVAVKGKSFEVFEPSSNDYDAR